MIVPTISILAFAQLALAASPANRIAKRQTAAANLGASVAVSGDVSPAEALAAGTRANANIAAIIVAIVASTRAAADAIAQIAAANAARTASVVAQTTAIASIRIVTPVVSASVTAAAIVASITSSPTTTPTNDNAATPACTNELTPTNQVSIIAGGSGSVAACSALQADITACSAFVSKTQMLQCKCQTTFLADLQTCGQSWDASTGLTYGQGNSTQLCNNCIDVGFQPEGACSGPPVARYCDCPTGQFRQPFTGECMNFPSASATSSKSVSSTSTSTSNVPGPTNLPVFLEKIQNIPAFLNLYNGQAPSCNNTCAAFEVQFEGCYSNTATNSSNVSQTQCICQTSFLGNLGACAQCEDSFSGFSYGVGNFSQLCNQCVTVGFNTPGSCSFASVSST